MLANSRMLRRVAISRRFKLPVGCIAPLQSRAYTWKGDNDDFRKPLEKYRNTDPSEKFDRAMKHEYKALRKRLLFWKNQDRKPDDDEWAEDERIFPNHVDVLVIGGGAMGSSTAYWLKKKAAEGLSVAVVEMDPTYSKSSTALSVGGLRQQFSIEENIEMSLFGADFIRTAESELDVAGESPIDVQFNPYGYLYLASEAGAEILQNNSKLQNELGAKNVILTANQLKTRFPWLNTDGINIGCLGLEKEGWFDPWALLYGLKRKAIALGADYVTGQVEDFTYRDMSEIMVGETGKSLIQGLSSAVIKTTAGERREIKFAIAVVAAGARSAEVARMAGIGVGEGVLSVPLPVEPRKRYAYCFHAPEGPGLNTPLTIDPSGTYFRRDGLANQFIAGRSPKFEEEPDCANLDVDENFFNDKVWPIIANRAKCFENIKLKSCWAGYYEYNKFDQNGIIGRHPYHTNLYFATGFSGHGIQQSPAAGRAISELIIDGQFCTIDLTRFGFDRLITLEPMRESNIV